ncbi:Uncharacterised protein [Mycobacteroides abscessus subsp. abscessus]|nr:Uncharacterised protein [Mycobacteroides abscessus subsp. abscessus]
MSRTAWSPSRRASCWDGSAANGMPSSRHSSVWRSIASGSLAPISTRSSCLLPASSAMEMSRASLIAPG